MNMGNFYHFLYIYIYSTFFRTIEKSEHSEKITKAILPSCNNVISSISSPHLKSNETLGEKLDSSNTRMLCVVLPGLQIWNV